MAIERTFEVGDRVVIRDWDDMADEFHDHNDSSINVGDECGFVTSMRYLCGRNGVVTRVYNNWFGDSRIKLNIDTGDWKISPGMLRHADDAHCQPIEVDRDQYIGFISGE